MKIYMFSIIKPANKGMEDMYGYEKVYKILQIPDIREDAIGKVFRGCDCNNEKILYSVYLLKDDKQKAMSLIEKAAKQDLELIEKQLQKQKDILSTITKTESIIRI